MMRVAVLLLVLVPLLVAGLLDALVGDPREGTRAERWYPPVLVGRLAGGLDRGIRRGDPRAERRAGLLLWTSTVGLATLVALALVLATGPSAIVAATALVRGSGTQVALGTAVLAIAYVVVVTGWLKSCFTLSGLLSFCARPLGRPLEDKRRMVAQVVNRPTGDLPDELLNSALIESAVENTTDSVVAPLLAYGLLGLVGAVAYRAVNTLDALHGHRDRHRRYVGEVAAAVDHAVNLLPDRLTAALIGLCSRGPRGPADVRAAPGTSVPRSIVAAARVIHVRLERRGSYVVGPDLPLPTEADVRRILRTVKYAGTVGFLLSVALLGGLVVAGWTYFL